MNTEFFSDKRIGIIGGGPGGLTLARLLQQKGINVTVYERDVDPYVRQQGATLDLHQDSGLKAIREAGLLAAFKENYRPGADRLRVVDEKAEVRFEDHEEKPSAAFNEEDFRPEIDRGPLRDMLINSLQEHTVVWGSQFDSMEKEKEGWRLSFRNGKTAYADIVVAADGAHSQIRSYMTSIRPVYSGMTIIEGNIYNGAENAPRLDLLANGGKVFALADEKTIILSAKGEGSLSFYMGFKAPENWVKECGIDFSKKEALDSFFKEIFHAYDPIWRELFTSDQSYFIPRPMYHFPLDQSWDSLTNLTMLGDAAHRMPPYTGEGVNMAMLDALELYENLTDPGFTNTLDAIAHYEKRMLKRTSEITQLTLEQTDRLHAGDSLNYLISIFSDYERS